MGHNLHTSDHTQASDSDENETCAHGLDPPETAVSVAFALMHRAQSYPTAEPNATVVGVISDYAHHAWVRGNGAHAI
ncbi:MAG TPA: hypothetical protein VMB18_19680 [Terriglobales bacterium]|nr:hypothetical protein [Terriglobales bacterium]